MHVTPFLTISPTFTTLSFWFLLGCAYIVYLLIHRKVFLRNVFLLLVSYVFAIAWDWRVPIVLFVCTVTSFFIALFLHRLQSARFKHVVLSVAVVGYIGVLAYCKYTNFFLDNINVLFRSIGLRSFAPGFSVILPLGLSFYIFQIISYLVDIARGKQLPTRDFVSYALFLAFFAKYIAGPIERAGNLLPQLQTVQHVTRKHLSLGFFLIIWGLVQKVVIADNAATYAIYSLLTPELISANSFTILLALPLQIYADFSGYSDIARGIATLFGFTLSRNFNMPYLALSPTDFWRRWHISLSQWCRDYIYIPLGGNRLGFIFTLRNLFLTMLIVGLWHGASWNFIAWGAYHGMLSVAYVLSDKYVSPDAWYAKILRKKVVAGILWFILVCIGWVIFQNFSSLPFWSVFASLRFSIGTFFPYILFFWMPIAAMHVLDLHYKQSDSIASRSIVLRVIFITICLYSLIYLTPFKHFDFVYKQF
ncbi:MAG: MBOAT family protein [Candidatus Peribacteraceae bacterium]|nr:MBOAT family protein [Candidatus Peribacteraceae bacterium]